MGFFKDLFFPRLCLTCNKPGTYICLSCQEGLIPATDRCFYCDKKSFSGLTHVGCRKDTGIDGIICFFRYNNTLKKIIKGIKYRLVRGALNELVTIVSIREIAKIDFMKTISKNTWIEPIPLHKNRHRQRGFNQAEDLAKPLAHYLKVPVVSGLVRKKDSPPQAGLKTPNQRRFNLLGCFAVSQVFPPTNKDVIMVDDIVTSGSTTREAARVLKQNGARKVYVIALGRG